jgi:hypothetical protein
MFNRNTSPLYTTKTPIAENIPSCAVCGRQDETLRAVIYPYVISLILMTFRREFNGVWCKKHRNLKLFLASLITSTIGWIGLPFGIILAPITLFKLARGSDQHTSMSFRILRELAEHRLNSGDTEGAVRCLEAALQVQDDDGVRERLSELYRMRLPTHDDDKKHPQAIPIIVLLLGAAALGAVIGILDYMTIFPSPRGEATWGVSTYVTIISWITLVAPAFVGGLVLRLSVERTLTRLNCHRKLFAIGLALLSACLALYSLLAGRTIAMYVDTLLDWGPAFESTRAAILTSGAVLTRGGVFTVLYMLRTDKTWTTIYLLDCCVLTFLARRDTLTVSYRLCAKG